MGGALAFQVLPRAPEVEVGAHKGYSGDKDGGNLPLGLEKVGQDGEKEQKTASFYDITTSESDYVFVLIYCSENTADPDSVGLYALRVVSKEKEDDYLEDVEDMEIPGICIPETAP